MIKSVREAKVHSTWASPNEEYEEALKAFLRDCLDTSRSNPFLDSFLLLQARIARLGVLNSLSQALLKLTVPGVPDIYQGCELWDLSLVDPDNRRPLDYHRQQRLLEQLAPRLRQEPASIVGLLAGWQDGAVKLAVTWLALGLRKEKPDLFAHGSYTALDVTGDRADHVCAFARVRGDDRLLVAVPRLVAALDEGSGWADTMLAIPGDARGRWRNVFTGAMLNPLERDGSAGLSAAHVFEAFPVALLTAAAT